MKARLFKGHKDKNMKLKEKFDSAIARFVNAWSILFMKNSTFEHMKKLMYAEHDQSLKTFEPRPGSNLKTNRHWRSSDDLRIFAEQFYSQNGEEGIILEIFRRIGVTNRIFVEFGVESGVECNTRYLAESLDWSGVYFEPSADSYEKLQQLWQENPKIQTRKAAITSSNFESELESAEVPKEFDLLSIDIDSNDYWVWKSLNNWSPRVVIIEYNPFHDPPKKWVMKEDPDFVWNATTYFGASFTSLYLLGHSKGYQLVGTDPMGVNMFFIRNDTFNELFLDPVLHYFFQPFAWGPPHPFLDGPHEVI